MNPVPTDGKTLVDFAQEGKGSLPQITHTSVHTGLDMAEKAKRWQVMGDAEKLMADLRQVDRLSASQIIAAHQDKVLELKARVRELEKEKETLKTAKLDKQLTADELRKQMRTLERERLEQEDILTNERDELKRRLAGFERRNQEMASRNIAREKALSSRLAVMEQSVRVGGKTSRNRPPRVDFRSCPKNCRSRAPRLRCPYGGKRSGGTGSCPQARRGGYPPSTRHEPAGRPNCSRPRLADQLGRIPKGQSNPCSVGRNATGAACRKRLSPKIAGRSPLSSEEACRGLARQLAAEPTKPIHFAGNMEPHGRSNRR